LPELSNEGPLDTWVASAGQEEGKEVGWKWWWMDEDGDR